MSVRISEIIEKDDDRVLFRGVSEQGKHVTFHVSRPGADNIVAAVESGAHVEVEL